MKKTLFTFSLSLLLGCCFAQNNPNHCGSEYIRQKMLANDPEFQKVQDDIEAFTVNYINNLPLAKKTRGTILTIPVVVHVIHNGENIGTGANISTNQINSQLTVLNKDFRLKNTDSLLPSHAYWAFTDDCEIEFCLAKQDPNGNYTSGIVRTDEGQSDYDFSDLDNSIKPVTIWDRNKYLNIWVCNLGGSAAGVLGYATPPGGFANEDGVVIRTISFGTTGNIVAPYHKGRTAVHEIGHFLNLRHIWGDDGSACSGSDQVSDTPNQGDENFGCPTFPSVSCSNGPNGDMFMNYMDYSDDACMKMFTNGQKNRMRAVLEAGGQRNSLTTSKVCTFPLGLQEASKEVDIMIFPNPSANHFYIKNTLDFSSDFTYQIFNALGQEFTSKVNMSKDIPSRYYVDVKGLPSGTYYIKIYSNEKQVTKSITIIK